MLLRRAFSPTFSFTRNVSTKLKDSAIAPFEPSVLFSEYGNLLTLSNFRPPLVDKDKNLY